MGQRRYTYEEKKNIITTFLRRRKTEGISLRWYSSEIEIPYYTIRDMYRDSRFNPEWKDRYSYSTQDCNKNKNRASNSDAGNIAFVRIG